MLKNIYLLFICTILITGTVMAGSLNMNAYSLNVKGDNNNNNLVGTSEGDRLDGKNGNDVLFGDLGADSFKCGKGVDTIKDFNSAEGDKKSSDCEKIGYNIDSSNGGIPAKLGIDQVQSNVQNIKCGIKGFFGSIDDSCFNHNSQNLANNGENLASQNGDYGKVGLGIGVKDGNSADPAINQVQSNVQNIKCGIKGFFGSIDDSCFNYNSQNLANKGNVALAQDGGNGRGSSNGDGDGDGDDGSGGGNGGGNSADPAINQAQSNVQNVQCVSGGGIDDSCFNYNSQNLANKGNVALAQDGGNGRGSSNGDGDGDGDDGSGGGNGGGNSADPAINQAQSNVQNVQCVSGGGIDDSCFNYNSQNLANKGNVALAQDGGNGRGSSNGDGDGDGDDGSGGGNGGGNSADPAINQAQSNVQNVQCVSGGGIDDSCFNYNSQNLANKGNVALAQDGGNGRGSSNGDGDGDGDDGSGGGNGGGNSADPAINQAQSNVQNVQCVSGKDAIVSCNNVSFQNQINEGNIALGQIY